MPRSRSVKALNIGRGMVVISLSSSGRGERRMKFMSKREKNEFCLLLTVIVGLLLLAVLIFLALLWWVGVG